MLFCVVGCATTQTSDSNTPRITGTASYRDGITLPKGARLHVTLLDLAAPGSAPLAQRSIPVTGASPFPFELAVSPAALAAAGEARLFAQIVVAERPWFSNVIQPARVTPDSFDEPVDLVLLNEMRPL